MIIGCDVFSSVILELLCCVFAWCNHNAASRCWFENGTVLCFGLIGAISFEAVDVFAGLIDHLIDSGV